MPYPGAHARVTWFGDSYTSGEIWQTGVRLAGTAVPTTGQMQALAACMIENLWIGTLSPPNRFRFLGVKWAPQDAAGKYGDDGEAVEYFVPAPVAGTSAAGYPQIALVLSLRTQRARGYASNGRMYIPSALAVGADGLITQPQADAAALAGAAFIGDVNAVGLGDASVMSSVGAGRSEFVTAVRVGRVMDTQRRRSNALPETYTVPAPVPT